MSYTHSLTEIVDPGGTPISATNSFSGSSHVQVSETVTTGQTDVQINVALDVSAIKSIIIKSDKAVTLETNSGSAAANTINLLANVPYIWNTNSYNTCLLTTDVTAIFITNASGSTATITLDAILDATP